MIRSFQRRIVFLGAGCVFAGVIAGQILFAAPADRSTPRAARSKEASSKEASETEHAAGEATIVVESSNPTAVYANFCRVTGTPEEVILDFGLNHEPFGMPTKPIGVQQRTVLNFYTAKRMLAALETTINRHEEAFGEIEVDVQKRVLQKE
ncbi:MAG TPA: DUF3467 domain-containing protein [Pirellulales bacterium]|nr:DUF3467 domain-containing protein [Pirellulales bacterium]